MLVEELSMAHGVTGDEEDIRKTILKNVSSYVDDISHDGLGSIIAHKKGTKKGPVIMISAHMDEVGLIITGINDDGTIGFEASGGIDAKVLCSKYVYIGKNNIPGIVRMVNGYKDAYIDAGFESYDETAEYITPGDYGYFSTVYEPLGNDYVKSKALDDRMGCAVLTETLKNKYDLPIYGVYSSQEEIGERGAWAASKIIKPDIGIVLEGTVCSDVTKVEPYRHSTTLGGGPAISIADRTAYFNHDLSWLACEAAEKNNIPYQRRRITGGGNDAGAIQVAGSGAKCVTISVPCRYIHSPICVTSLVDYGNTIKLLDLFLKEIAKM